MNKIEQFISNNFIILRNSNALTSGEESEYIFECKSRKKLITFLSKLLLDYNLYHAHIPIDSSSEDVSLFIGYVDTDDEKFNREFFIKFRKEEPYYLGVSRSGQVFPTSLIRKGY